MEEMEHYSCLIRGVIASAEMERDANIFVQNHWRTSCPDSIQVSHSQTATTRSTFLEESSPSYQGKLKANVYVNL